MRVLLVDADSKKGFPNLALMKISAWLKQQGDTVHLIRGIPTTAPIEEFGKVYISCIYFQNKEKVLDYASQFDIPVSVGGSGIDLEKQLPCDIEHIMPDYVLYHARFSMGFTSRGCIRACGFCIVPKKEGAIRDHASIAEFLHHDRLMLLDNNFLASPRWKENLQFIIDNRLKINFNQGLDIRLLDEEKAQLLSEAQYYSWDFVTKGLHFAFDNMHDEETIRAGVKLLHEHNVPAHHLMFYILVGYNTTLEQDLYRIQIIQELGAVPYIMPYNQCKNPLTRWVNRKYYEFIPWNEYRGSVTHE